MTTPSSLPPDREEHVEVVNQPSEYEERRVVRHPGVEHRAMISQVNQVLWLLFGFLEALIAIRIFLKLIGANPAAAFSQIIYGVTEIFLWPFNGLTINPTFGAVTFEISSIIAMLVYGLIGWGITRLLWILFYRPDTTTVTTYREDR